MDMRYTQNRQNLSSALGATDKYGVPLSAYPSGAVTAHDVMRLDRTRLARLRVDPLTAVEVGWLSRLRGGQEEGASGFEEAGD